MIRKFSGYETTKAYTPHETKRFPAGGYEAKILNAEVVRNKNGSESLAVSIDVTAGEFKDFFKTDYSSNPFDNKKWRGVARFFLPKDDGSKDDERTKSSFKAMTEAVEKSNQNYQWNWDEQSLKGLKVGILVRDREYEAGKFTHDIFAFTDIKIIKNGEFPIPKPKYLNGNAPSAAPSVPDAPPMPSDSDAPPANDDYPF